MDGWSDEQCLWPGTWEGRGDMHVAGYGTMMHACIPILL